jgi:hypothetical protein
MPGELVAAERQADKLRRGGTARGRIEVSQVPRRP